MRTINPYRLDVAQNKIGDSATIWWLQLLDDGVQKALDNTMTAVGHLSQTGSYLFDVDLSIQENLIELNFDDEALERLPAGNYGLEIDLKLSDGTIAKYPTDGTFNFDLQANNLSANGGLLPTISVQTIIDKLDAEAKNIAATMAKGDPGNTGQSAYDIWKSAGNTGSVQDFLESLKGPAGAAGNILHLAWSDSADGTKNFSTQKNSSASYIGYLINTDSSTSSNASDYTWIGIFDPNSLLKNVYYSGVETTQYYDEQTQTVYYLTKVPAVDENGKAIQIKQGFAFGVPNHQNGYQTPASFLADHPTATLISNAAPSSIGNIIANGKIISSTADGLIDQATMAVLKDGTLTWYPTKTTSETMLADGVVNSFTGFWPIIVGGKAFDVASVAEVVSSPGNDWTYLQKQQPRNVICQLADKSLLFLTAEGRLKHNVGLSFDDLIRILLPLNVVFAYNFDGGGSVSLINKGVRINAPYDGNFTKERAVSNFLYIDKIDGQTSPDPKQQVNYQVNLKSTATYNILAHQLLDLEHNSNFSVS